MVILALISVAIMLLVGVIAFGTAVDSSGASGPVFSDIVGIVNTSFELTAFIPLILIVGLFITTLGVLAQQ